MESVSDCDIQLVDQYAWTLDIDEAELSLSCPICGNTVKSDGVTAEIGGETRAFCCPSCKKEYERQYEFHQSQSD